MSTRLKGKSVRSWAELPAELICQIATYCWASNKSPLPYPWRDHRLVSSNMYSIYRDVPMFERLMNVTPLWSQALEQHYFWTCAAEAIDSGSIMLPHILHAQSTGSKSISLSPFQIYSRLSRHSCAVCRVIWNHSPHGLGIAKEWAHSIFGLIPVCKQHAKAYFCGVCLRPQANENEDDETWPNIEATCKECRWEMLSRHLRGVNLQGDWQIRSHVESFLEAGEGNIKDILHIVRERVWLQENTKLMDMLSNAVAASKLSFNEEEDEELISDDDDYELCAFNEDSGGVKDLALGDWARARILDGHWYCPADEWYKISLPDQATHVPATHPCSWAAEEPDQDHPRSSTLESTIPPTYQLCEQAYGQFVRQMRTVLLPAMTNLVRKIVVESSADGADIDPTLRVTRLSLEDVVEALRDEMVWYDGIDWLERKRNQVDSPSDSGSSRNTSPVLSTSTLKTTPSPPPKEEVEPRPLPIRVAPVLQTPILLHAIPYIPNSLAHLPSQSREAIRSVWREAMSPLFQCKCSICLRAVAKANAANDALIQAATKEIDQAVSQRQKSKAIVISPQVPHIVLDRQTSEMTDEFTEEEFEGRPHVVPSSKRRIEAPRLTSEELDDDTLTLGSDGDIPESLKRSSADMDDTRDGKRQKRESSIEPVLSPFFAAPLNKKRGSPEQEFYTDSPKRARISSIDDGNGSIRAASLRAQTPGPLCQVSTPPG